MESAAFDYVIVGGGSAGCVLAARLSEDAGVYVCLLEAATVLDDTRLFRPGERALGGSSSTNAMLYTRGHPSDYDAWARLGNFGWTFRDVLPYFKRAQNQERGASLFHGVGGPLHVCDLRRPNVLSQTFIQAGIQSGIPFNEDFNCDVQEGVGLFQVMQKSGRRCSTAQAYLQTVRHRPNLKIVTGARARRVLFEGTVAIGVEYQRKGRLQTLRASREVVLAAGAIQSPHLLMLSGVGDCAELRAAKVPLVEHIPGVGKNLQDHLSVIVAHRCAKPATSGITPWLTMLRSGRDLARYVAVRAGIYTTPGPEGCGFAKSGPDEPIPDLQLHFTPGRLIDHTRAEYGGDGRFMRSDGYSLHVYDCRPKSRGEIRLAGNDPFGPPDIVANDLSHPEDLERLVKGVKLARAILEAPAFDRFRGEELRPGPECRSEEDLRQFVRRQARTSHHPAGTCKMGNDAMSVVDAQLRVHGLQRLRVADASIMPLLIGGNTNAPVVMIAEKASDLIKQARNPRARYPYVSGLSAMPRRIATTALEA